VRVLSLRSLQSVTTDSDGSFCYFGVPGTYYLSATVTEAESKLGLFLSPQEHSVTVSSTTVCNGGL
jgi:hypothetical protein